MGKLSDRIAKYSWVLIVLLFLSLIALWVGIHFLAKSLNIERVEPPPRGAQVYPNYGYDKLPV